jgi:Na+-translocating ferredoxin:NAD+ oxidoreductase RnfG subunit
MQNPDWKIIPALIAPAIVCAPAFAIQYLTVEQAQRALFPEATQFVQADITLTPELKRRIEEHSGVRVRSTVQRVWRAEAAGKMLGWFMLDEVIGKHEFITYAVAVAPDGAVKGIDILDYRETHGSEVKNVRWRQQFVGKKSEAPLQLDADIQNISGATLSCKNVTNGVKRLLATYEAVLK